MILALILFALIYILMLALPQQRPFLALYGAAAFLLLGQMGVYDFTLAAVLTGYGCLWLVWGQAPVCLKKQRRDSQL